MVSRKVRLPTLLADRLSLRFSDRSTFRLRGLFDQLANSIGRLRAFFDPVTNSVGLELDLRRLACRIVRSKVLKARAVAF